MAKISVLGAGSWGTALAILLEDNGHQVQVWSALEDEVEMLQRTHEHETKLPGVKISEAITFTGDLEGSVRGRDVVVLAVPSPFTRETAHKISGYVEKGQRIVNVAKGVEEGSLMTLSEIIEAEIPQADVAVLSGPSHAEEVGRRIPTTCVVSAGTRETAEYLQSIFMSPVFRVYTTPDMLGVELGWVILVGIFCGVVSMIVAGPVWGGICGNKCNISVPEHVAKQEDFDESKLPNFWAIVGIILIPLVLIILDSVTGVVPALASLQPIFAFLGEPFVALLIATVAAMLVLGIGHGYNTEELEKVMTKSLEPTGLILLVTACGGVLRYVLQYSGMGDVIGDAVSSMSLPIVLLAFIVAALVRICVGSATVAMTMAAGIIASIPGISELSPLYLACTTAAVAGGATVCSHFNDSGFWLVKSLVGMDEKTTLKTWTIMETLVGGTGFIVALIISFFA